MAKFTTTVAFLLTSCGATASSSSGGNNSNNFLSGSASSSSTITYTEEEAERRRLNLSGNIKGSLTFKGTHTSQTQHSFQQQGSKSKHVTFSAGAHGQVHQGQVQHKTQTQHSQKRQSHRGTHTQAFYQGGQQAAHGATVHVDASGSAGGHRHFAAGSTGGGNSGRGVYHAQHTTVGEKGATTTSISYGNNGSHFSMMQKHNTQPPNFKQPEVNYGGFSTVNAQAAHVSGSSSSQTWSAVEVKSGHCNIPFTMNGDKEKVTECARGKDGSWCPVKTGRNGAFSTTNPKHTWMWCTVGGGSSYVSGSSSTFGWTHSSSGYSGECKPPSREQMEKHLKDLENKIDLKQLLKTKKGTGEAQVVPNGCKTEFKTDIVEVRCDLQGNFELQWNCGGKEGHRTTSSSWSSSSSASSSWSSSSSGAVAGAGDLSVSANLNGHMNANAGFHHTTVTHHRESKDIHGVATGLLHGVATGVLKAAGNGNFPKVDISKVDLSQVGKVGVAGALVGGIALAAGGLILHLSGEGESCVMKSNVDYWGHDLKGPVQNPVQAATPKKCQDKCKATKDCHYFQWKENKNCWLKDINAENSPLANFLPHPTHISPGAVFGHKDCGFTESSSSSSTSSGSTSSSSGSSSSSSSSTSSSSGSSSSSSSSTSSSSNISSSSSTSPSILSSVSIQHTKEDGVETNINESTSSSITNINNVINYVIETGSCQEGFELNEAQCKAVADTYQKGTFKPLNPPRDDQPKGCFLKNDNTVRYNGHAIGKANPNKRVICLEGGNAHVETKRPPTATVPPSSTHVGHTNVVSTDITTTIDRLTNQKKRPWCMLHKVHKVVHAVQNFEDVIEPRRRELLF